MVELHEALVRMLVTELHGFDNLYYEICDEPDFGGVALDWQVWIAEIIVNTDKSLGSSRHRIAQNIANGRAKITVPNPAVSLFNFHYATPPDVVALNAGLSKAIGDDKTGFRGTADRSMIKGGVPDKASVQALVRAGREYAIYLMGGTQVDLAIELPPGHYRAEWVNPTNGIVDKAVDLEHAGRRAKLSSPRYEEDIALRLRAGQR